SMKTLAYMETRKLNRLLEAQQCVVESIEDVATDFLSFHQDILPRVNTTTAVYLLIGTERGFCGNFNHVLLKHLENNRQSQTPDNTKLVVVGHKLQTLLQDDVRLVASVNGASVAEEVTSLLTGVVNELMALQNMHGGLSIFCIYHNDEDDIVTKRLLPPFEGFSQRTPAYSHSPQLNQSPEMFLADLTEHYLFALLHEMLYTSLMAENYKRVSHLEGAVKHLDDEAEKLTRQCNALRQEEIVEEIEVILLSTGHLDASRQAHKSKD
ncbi:MAG: FoF1 ATP synthase subunit gamma, partial [Gammaproteobacteria bacterium]